MGGMLIFWIVSIIMAVLLVRGLFQTKQPRLAVIPLAARQILEQRYARGEINREQYQSMLKDLQ